MEDEGAPAIVARGLLDSEWQVVDQAYRAIWANPNRYAGPVEQLMRQTPKQKWQPLLNALGAMGESGASVLKRQMARTTGAVRRQIGSSLVYQRDTPKGARDLVNDPDPTLRWRAYMRLSQSPEPAFRAAFLKGLDDASPAIRELVSQSFRSVIAPKMLPTLTRVAKDPSPRVRLNAVAGLGNLRYLEHAGDTPPKALDALFKMLSDSDPSVLTEVAKQLAGFASNDTRRAMDMLAQESVQARPMLTSLRAMLENKDVRSRLAALASDTAPPAVARMALLALASFRDPRALDPLLKLLDQPGEVDPHILGQALGTLGDPAATPALLRAIEKDSKWGGYGSSWLISALGDIRDSSAAPHLRKILFDPSEDAQRRSSAGRALAQMPDPKVQEWVVSFVRDTSVEATTRANVVYGLAWISSEEAYDALIACLTDASLGRSAWTAVGALRLRGDPRAIPHLEPLAANSSKDLARMAKDAIDRLRRIEAASGTKNPPK